MADSAASTQSRPPRASSKKRRVSTVPTETENKLARAARSAQRLAQLSDASRDDSTLDMFPDDPTRATLEAMNIDIRQGTLHGFELPDVVLAAVGATTSLDGAISAASEARAARRAAREQPAGAYATVPLAGFERIEPTQEASAGKNDASAEALGEGGVAAESVGSPSLAASAGDSRTSPPVGLPLVSPSMAAASLVRSVTARRQVADALAVPRAPTETAKPAGVPPYGVAASVAKAATSAEPIVGTAEKSEPVAVPEAASYPASHQDTAPTAPELDRARATAFADTVDALYGVISDQRRAATDHSHRMRWMLSIVVGALLMTVAIGVTQTVLLMRLTRETTAQQHRIEQLMQNEQTAMTSLLDAHLAMANSVAVAPSAASAPAVAPSTAAVAAPTPPANKRKAHTHAHKPKVVPSH